MFISGSWSLSWYHYHYFHYHYFHYHYHYHYHHYYHYHHHYHYFHCYKDWRLTSKDGWYGRWVWWDVTRDFRENEREVDHYHVNHLCYGHYYQYHYHHHYYHYHYYYHYHHYHYHVYTIFVVKGLKSHQGASKLPTYRFREEWRRWKCQVKISEWLINKKCSQKHEW